MKKEEIKVIENELVPVYETSTGEKVVYGTELYECLGSKRQYTDWIKQRLKECDAVENVDYQSFSQKNEKPQGGRPVTEHIIKLDTAKEMAMLERNEKGKQVRRYFITVEKKYKEKVRNKNINQHKQQEERLASVNNAVKILTPMLKAAGCDSKIQLLTAKTLYEKAGVALPIQIEADKQYYDTVHIARKVGLYYQSSEKPADKAVNEIIRRLDLSEDMYVETWESKGKWQGTVRKYAAEVISMVKQWYVDNGYPREIEYTQTDGQVKRYHVLWRDMEVA